MGGGLQKRPSTGGALLINILFGCVVKNDVFAFLVFLSKLTIFLILTLKTSNVVIAFLQNEISNSEIPPGDIFFQNLSNFRKIWSRNAFVLPRKSGQNTFNFKDKVKKHTIKCLYVVDFVV